MQKPIIILAIITFGIYLLNKLANRCFDDNDPDLNWYDNYKVDKCPHLNKTDVTVESNVTCETIHTICDDCGKILNVRTDC